MWAKNDIASTNFPFRFVIFGLAPLPLGVYFLFSSRCWQRTEGRPSRVESLLQIERFCFRSKSPILHVAGLQAHVHRPRVPQWTPTLIFRPAFLRLCIPPCFFEKSWNQFDKVASIAFFHFHAIFPITTPNKFSPPFQQSKRRTNKFFTASARLDTYYMQISYRTCTDSFTFTLSL